jgi:FixJ family two-component response regulator
MAGDDRQHIFFVDDELKVCETVSETLEQLGSKVTYFTRAEECLEHLSSKRCDLLIADLVMPGMNGIELLIRAKHLRPWLPVLIITGYGDIPTAVSAMQKGAVDFLEKPLETETFLQKVGSILQKNQDFSTLMNMSLTKMEMKVLKLIVQGNSSKEIAFFLNRSRRTIETHRANVMKKLGVDNVVELIKQASLIGLVKFPNNNHG